MLIKNPFVYLFIFTLFTYLVWARVSGNMCGGQDNLWESALPSHVGAQDQIRSSDLARH